MSDFIGPTIEAAKVVDGELYVALGYNREVIAFRALLESYRLDRTPLGFQGQIVFRIIDAKAGPPDAASALEALALPPADLKNTTPGSG